MTHGLLLAKGHCPNGSHQEASPCLLPGLGLGGLSGRSVGDPAALVANGSQTGEAREETQATEQRQGTMLTAEQ